MAEQSFNPFSWSKEQKVIAPSDLSDVLPNVLEVRVPALAAFTDGQFLLAFDARMEPDPHLDWEKLGGAMAADLPNPNSLLIMRGCEGEFSAPEILRHGDPSMPTGYSDPAIIIDGDKVCIVHARSRNVGFFGSQPLSAKDPANTLQIEVLLSTDRGQSWSSRCITDDVLGEFTGAFATSGHGVVIDGKWLIPLVAKRCDGTTTHMTISSSDQGQRWVAGTPVGVDMDETAYGINGKTLVLSARKTSAYASGELGRWWAHSTDAGTTWSTPVFSPEPAAAACNAALVSTSLGLVLCYSGKGRVGGFVALYRSGTWVNAGFFTHGPCGYIDAVVIGDEIVVVFEKSGELWLCSTVIETL
ncbi:sialidase family protein [Corynebacterium felinum]|uniref:exo-alpha-sialidase n=1 Tax=Corynebacterium felinum TaxID=131318 RepID=A0ABU2B4I0_9CORY|nr:sialidase family protein [Corynebacterium felinum]MDF5821685.1 sialidase family protein [Corynebacterium felinum]MDR7353521.1 sialidase-1 [Corynebacterium felinum]WJY95701.1 Sialidase precursor [Corynebacterium felinum]